MKFDGVININKPEGMTSHDVVSKVRRKLGIKRVGHSGTLDPMATGVLPVCVGNATRIIEYYDPDFKVYVAEMKLGIVTDTYDISGEILKESSFTEQMIIDLPKAVSSFTGFINQYPPKYSAVRVGGRRLYEYARSGDEVEIPSRRVFISYIDILSIDAEKGLVKMEICCSKGTYIRSIIYDIGEKLGCGATMTYLCRTGSGCFEIYDSIDLNILLEMSEEQICGLVKPAGETLAGYAGIELAQGRVKAFRDGMSTSPKFYRLTSESDFAKDPRFSQDERLEELSKCYLVYSEGSFLGLGSIGDDNELRAVKVIYAGN
ncbi:MAG: tRNA pseudouridine(55) synthase TruB [Mogibacterium sp.]|nr:tRNA pseudouridine(55) synthase TruB [Mogibacterium sp.]